MLATLVLQPITNLASSSSSSFSLPLLLLLHLHFLFFLPTITILIQPVSEAAATTLAPPPSLSSSSSSSSTSATTSYYHSDLDLDFLCKSRTLPAFVRDVPWDCSSYVVCLRGRAFHSRCPEGRLYSSRGRGRKCLPTSQVNAARCQGQIFDYTDQICRANPSARIPSPDSCAHYVDCRARQRNSFTGPADTTATTTITGAPPPAGFLDGLLECSYPLLFSPATGRCEHFSFVRCRHTFEPKAPSLFSPATGRCEHFSFVRCRHTFEPKAPCDYLQYLQIYHCDAADCSECERHHPSCLFLTDGYHPVPGRRDVMMRCQGERTVDFLTCPPGFGFPIPVGKGGHYSPHCVRKRGRRG
ncbi:uncharacterized protein LOC143275260 [Babylonia areolata]|uniref:uncharacterized protein LOC143275260 n=1 Tax=Babylonia areolata TaxID=304850 RepID=UPI003FD04364